MSNDINRTADEANPMLDLTDPVDFADALHLVAQAVTRLGLTPPVNMGRSVGVLDIQLSSNSGDDVRVWARAFGLPEPEMVGPTYSVRERFWRAFETSGVFDRLRLRVWSAVDVPADTEGGQS